MTWVNIALGGHRNIFIAAAAASQTLYSAGTLVQVYHEMEEIEIIALFPVFDNCICKAVIFLKYSRKILIFDTVIKLRIGNNRLYGKLVKAKLIEMKYVICKIEIVLGECTTDIIILVSPALYKLLIFRNDHIIAATSVRGNSHPVIYFFSAVK